MITTNELILYVSPQGDDGWSGHRPEAAADRGDGPLATPQAAVQRAVAERGRGKARRAVRIVLRGGTYFLDRPLCLTPAQGGLVVWGPIAGKSFSVAREMPLTFAAFPGETPVLSGGVRLSGWRVATVNGRTAWVTDLPESMRGGAPFRQLFVNGERRFRPRLPRTGLYQVLGAPGFRPNKQRSHWMQGHDRFTCRPGEIQAWPNFQDVEVVMLQRWIESRQSLTAFDPHRNLVTMDRKSHYSIIHDGTDPEIPEGCRYYVENVFSALTEPGEWYLDRAKGCVYYLPLPGEEIATAEVIVPRLACLVELSGKVDEAAVLAAESRAKSRVSERDYEVMPLPRGTVQLVHFTGITFSHTEWHGPAGRAGSMQASHDVPGAVILRRAEMCGFDRCRFVNLGTYAVEMLGESTANTVTRCELRNLGGGGVKIWHGGRRNTVSDCEISRGGQVFHSSVGVLIGQAAGNRILHNHIHDFYYTAVSIGWLWGFAESRSYGNLIEHNHIHDIGKDWLSDMGGIYALGFAPGTRIRFNVIHDVRSGVYGGVGIYPDEGSCDLLIENNLVYRCRSFTFSQHFGRDNVVRNNIFVDGEENQVALHRDEPGHCSLVFENNIVVYRHGETVKGGYMCKELNPIKAGFRHNLYWNSTGVPPRFFGKTLKEWQATGMDAGSVTADPMFIAPERDDYRLRPDSPAPAAIGFAPFDWSGVGPRGVKA